MATEYPSMQSGFRAIPDNLLASGQPLSVALYRLLEHNFDLYAESLEPRQLVNDFYPNDSEDTDPTVTAPASGVQVAQWGRFQKPNNPVKVTAKVYCKTDDDGFNPILSMISTPYLQDCDPTTISGFVANQSGNPGNLSYGQVVISGETYSWYDLELEPDFGEGNWCYLAAYVNSGDLADPVDFLVRQICVTEIPKRTLG